MILQKEIIEKAQQWKVPPETVDKDYVLGHFLSVFLEYFPNQLVFKGGTCLRKCYFENYRFSEDLDFSSTDPSFELKKKQLKEITEAVAFKTGIQFFPQEIKPLVSNNQPKGYQVYLKYWGANHSKNKRPLPQNRWLTKIKLEISTQELILLPKEERAILHPYSDELQGQLACDCYSIDEVVTEKLRALKQRSYTAPRDFYDLFHLTAAFSEKDWERIKPIFIEKMKHKNLSYHSPEDLITNDKIKSVKKAWNNSVAHQIDAESYPDANVIIQEVVERIKKHLPNGE